MALTKKDIEVVSKLFNDGLTLMVMPSLTELLEWKDGVDEKLELIDGSIKAVNRRIDDSVGRADNHHKKTMETIGKYYYDTASKKEFNLLAGRVHKLELACS